MPLNRYRGQPAQHEDIMRIKTVLYAFIPLAALLEHFEGVPDPVVFFAAALAIIPIAALIVHATEQVARHIGDAWGGLLNATFGNAPELIISVIALKAGLHEMVRASLIGAILANLLLAQGLAYFLGGLRHHEQTYQPTASRLYSSMMLIVVISLAVPSAVSRFFAETGTAPQELTVNLLLAFILLTGYALFLVFMLKPTPNTSRVSTWTWRRKKPSRNGRCRVHWRPCCWARAWQPG